MAYLRILHNGDLRKETPLPSPHWMVHMHEDGRTWGEVLLGDWGRTLPSEFRIADHERFLIFRRRWRSTSLRHLRITKKLLFLWFALADLLTVRF